MSSRRPPEAQHELQEAPKTSSRRPNMSSRSRNHVIYEFLLLGTSKNIGLAAFLASKTQPNRGFGGPENAKARILRGFRGCRTMVSEASRRETTYFTWFGDIFARESLPGGLRKTSGGSPEAPEAARRAPRQPRDVSGRSKSTYFTWFRSGAALKSLVKYVVLAPGTLQNLGLAALFNRKPRPNRHFWSLEGPKVRKTRVIFDLKLPRTGSWPGSPHLRRPRNPRRFYCIG